MLTLVQLRVQLVEHVPVCASVLYQRTSFVGIMALVCCRSHFADLFASFSHRRSLHIFEKCICLGIQRQSCPHVLRRRRRHFLQRLVQSHEPCLHWMDLACFTTIRSWLQSRLWPLCCHRRQYRASLLPTWNDAPPGNRTSRRNNTGDGVDKSHILHLFRKHICQ